MNTYCNYGKTIKTGLQNRKERPNRSTNNGNMAEIAKHPVSDGVSL